MLEQINKSMKRSPFKPSITPKYLLVLQLIIGFSIFNPDLPLGISVILAIDDVNSTPIIDGEEDDVSKEDNNTQVESQNAESSSPNQNKERKRKKLTSTVWKSFTFLEQEPEQPLYCKCNKCGKRYLAESRNGTGNLKRHLEKCTKSTTKEIGQFMVTVDNSMLSMRTSKFNQERFHELVINAIVRHDLPFSFVEYEGIRSIFKYLEPSVTFISRNTANSKLIKLHQREKSKLRGELIRCSGRISLTSDCWTSIVTDGYLSLTAHYIDSNWVLQKRILNFSYMPPPHTGVALAEKISGLVKSWGVEKKLFSITLDNASSNDVCVDVLRNQFRLTNSLVYDGKLFHLRCCAHVLNLIVKDRLEQINVAVDKVRECDKYVKGSQAIKEKFRQCCSQTNLDCKKALMQDVPTRWNSTYKMLSTTLYYRLAFCHPSLSDSNFQTCPSMDEWTRVEKICDFLELKSQDDYMKMIATKMWEKFNKYWNEFNLLLAVAVVFDPRYKFSFVKFAFEKLYGKSSPQLETVRNTLYGLFNEYVQSSKNLNDSTSCDDASELNFQEAINKDENTSKNIQKEFDLYDCASSSTSNKKCQLTEYLDEPRTKTNGPISILDYWKAQQYRYPDVARLAMDILCVPVSTVASESAFSLGGRILDQYRSSMLPSTVEALICTRDWLYVEKATSPDIEVTQNIMAVNMDKDDNEDSNLIGH